MSRQAAFGLVTAPNRVGSGLEVVGGDQLIAVWAGPAGAEAAAEDVAVGAALVTEVALFAGGAFVDRCGALRRWRGWCLAAGSVVGLAAGV